MEEVRRAKESPLAVWVLKTHQIGWAIIRSPESNIVTSIKNSRVVETVNTTGNIEPSIAASLGATTRSSNPIIGDSGFGDKLLRTTKQESPSRRTEDFFGYTINIVEEDGEVTARGAELLAEILRDVVYDVLGGVGGSDGGATGGEGLDY